MRSKCRCSCVLQFTLRHAFSSVLHRPPSQLIHCIALYLGYQRQASMIGAKMYVLHNYVPGRGVSKRPERPASLVRPSTVPELRAARSRTLGTKESRAGSRLDDPPQTSGASETWLGKSQTRGVKVYRTVISKTFNDPSAGSPTETLLRLLLPLSATVWSSFR